jgi:phosphate transport system protein
MALLGDDDPDGGLCVNGCEEEKAIEVAAMDDRMDAMRDAINMDLFAMLNDRSWRNGETCSSSSTDHGAGRLGDNVTPFQVVVYMDKGSRQDQRSA